MRPRPRRARHRAALAAVLSSAALVAALPASVSAQTPPDPPSDGAWADLGNDGPAGPGAGAWTGAALLVHDDATDAVWSYDGQEWTRTEAAQPGPPGVTGAAVAFAGGRLWAFGGQTEAGADTGELWSWQPASGQPASGQPASGQPASGEAAAGWRRVPDTGAAPGPRSDAAMTTDGRALYLYGGRRSGALRDDFWRFDTQTGAWTALRACQGASGCPGPRAGAAMAAFASGVWLFGGEGPDGLTAALHRATGEGAWEAVASAPHPPPLSGHRLVALPDALLLLAGCAPAGPVSWRYVPGAEWQQLHPTPMAPAVAQPAVAFDGTRVHEVGGIPCSAGPASIPLHVALTPGPVDEPERVALVTAADDPVALGVAASQAVFPDLGARVAVLGTASAFADSLAGTPLTWGPGGADGPLLFSPPAELAEASAAELRRVLPQGATVYLLGGEAALSAQIERDVEALGLRAARLSGTTRVETAAAIARRVDRLRDLAGGGRRALLADSRSFPDAVAAGGWAAAEAPVPILLTPGDGGDLHPAVRETLEVIGAEEVVLLGGPAALSQDVEAAVKQLDVEVTRVAGEARDGTAAAIATELWGRTERGQGYGFVAVDLFSAPSAWAAALAAAPLAATARAPLLALNGALPDRLPPATAAYLAGMDFHPDRPGFAWVLGPAPEGARRALAQRLGGRG